MEIGNPESSMQYRSIGNCFFLSYIHV